MTGQLTIPTTSKEDKMRYGLTIKDVWFARTLFKSGFITWADAMEFLKEIYDENN